MDIAARYSWEAETDNGRILRKGGDLAGVRRFSLIPAHGAALPRHDLAGIPFIRRFGSGFVKIHFNNQVLPGRLFWQDGSRVVKTSEDLTGLVSPGDLIGKGVAGETWWQVNQVTPSEIVLNLAYLGKSKPRGMPSKKLNTRLTREYVQCVVCEGFRVYVRCSDGTVLVTPADYELNL